MDNGRSEILASEEYRETLRCIRCGACLNACPIYRKIGGHAYGSVYPGPIGALITPLMQGLDKFKDLPQASSLCGACYEACPVKIDIPNMLVHLRGRIVREQGAPQRGEPQAMAALAKAFSTRRKFELALRVSRHAPRPAVGPLKGWLSVRDLPEPPKESFRDWWSRERGA